jgi:hypothetical protein
MTRVLLVVGLLGIGVLGCGGDGRAPFSTPNPKGDRDPKDSSVDEEIVDAGDSGTVVPQTGPLLEFTTPQPADSPTDDTVITARDIAVRCRVKERPGSKAGVDRASVKITLDKNKEGTSKVSAPTDALPDDEYEAKFDLSTLPNGVLRFHCEAKDMAAKPATASIKLETLLDLGPTIEVFDPKDDGVYALKSPVVIQFQVTSAPLSDADPEAEVKSVKLYVSGTEIPLTETDGKPGLYQTSVNFQDKALFKVPPTSSEVSFTATNARSPEAAMRSVKADISIDGLGPTVRVRTPLYNSIGHGEVELTVEVTDPAGVKPRSLKADINAGLLKIEDWEVMGTVYKQKFDTRKFDRELVQITINLTAQDSVGNENFPVSHLLNLDNLPPLVSLDPPYIREWKKVGTNYYCGEAFDPIGSDAISDLDTALEASLYRVFVEDWTIFAPGANIAYYAGVSGSTVALYAQPDPSIPLLYDSNGDGVCDEINLFDLPEPQQPRKLDLGAATPRGASWFPKAANIPVDYFAAPENDPSKGRYGTCIADPNGAVNPPGPLCSGFPPPPRRIVAGRGADKPPAVYGLSPSNDQANACEGETWHVLNIVGEGWACLAARAEDKIGNIGVSEAIRVCFNKTGGSCAGAPPNCNKNSCQITDAQKFEANEVWEVR